MPPAERRALLLLLGLAVAGHAVRFALTRPAQAPGEVELVRTLPAQSPLAHKDSIITLARPLEPGERVDIDRVGAEEIARLPRLGLALAKRIVADRAARGPFGSLDGLDRVPGIGASLLAAIAGNVEFSGAALGSAGAGLASGRSPPAPSGTLPGLAPCPHSLAGCGAIEALPSALHPAGPQLSLNTATVAQLDSLPGIGPKRAQAIVRDREQKGPFPSVDALTRVPGIKPALVARVRQRLQVP